MKPYRYFAALLILSACHTLPLPQKASLDLPRGFDNVRGLSSYHVDLSHWWDEWHDPVLSRLITEGLTHSHSVQVVQERINMADAFHRITRNSLWPMTGLMGKRSWMNSDFTISELPLLGEGDESLPHPRLQRVAIAGQWSLDFLGNHFKTKSAYYKMLSAQEMLYANQMMLAGKIAQNYFDGIATNYQKEISDKVLSVLQQLLFYTQKRFEAGHTSINKISQIKAKIAQLQSERPLLDAKLDDIDKNMAVLIGKVPQGFHVPYRLQTLNHRPTLPTGFHPGDLLYRRPDLLAKERLIQSLLESAKAARSDLLPKFTINFMLSDGKITVGSLLKGLLKGPLYGVGVQLPIFPGYYQLIDRVKIADSQVKGAIEEYNQTLLNTLREVDSSYHLCAAYDKNVASLKKANQALGKRVKDSRKLFHYGEITYDEVLMNEIEQLKAEEELIRSQLEGLHAMVNLYQALGGGWREGKEPQSAAKLKNSTQASYSSP